MRKHYGNSTMSGKYLEKLNKELLDAGKDEAFIARCLDYAKRLVDEGLPVIFDVKHLALLLGIDYGPFITLTIHGTHRYKTIRIKKKRGGHRTIRVPSTSLKYIQRWILDNIISQMYCSEAATGFVPGTSIKKNAERHLNCTCLLNIDIKDFFPSITYEDVFRIFRYYGYTYKLASCLANICTEDDELPQGAPTSPMLANIRCIKLDRRIKLLCEKYKANYSRYADDITISGNGGIANIIEAVTEIITDEGFEINEKKTRILFPHQRQEITGLIINNGIIRVPREFKKELKKEIYYCKKYGPTDHQKHIGDTHSFYKEHLYGKAYYVNMIEPDVGNVLLDELDAIDWEN